MTTNQSTATPVQTAAQKQARVHALRDPLGAAGFRATRTRRAREEHARLATLVGTIISFATIFTGIAITDQRQSDQPPATTPGQANNVISEFLIPSPNDQSPATLIRIVAPEPHVTTRSS